MARKLSDRVAAGAFLDGVPLRPVELPSAVSLAGAGLALGHGTSPLEVLVATAAAQPNATTLRSAWKTRNGGRAAPLLLVALHGERASVDEHGKRSILDMAENLARRLLSALRRRGNARVRCEPNAPPGPPKAA